MEVFMCESSTPDFFDQISIEMGFDRFSLDIDDPNEYFYVVEGKIILLIEHEDQDEDEEIIGAFRLLSIDVNSALDNKVSLYEVYDCDGEAFEFYENAINLEDGEFNSKITNILGDNVNFRGDNVLIIDRIGICPEYRGHHLALMVLRKLIQRFSQSVSIVAIKPAPFEFTSRHIKPYNIDWQHAEIVENSSDSEKLGKYYQKLGFKKLSGSSFMVLGTDIKLPDV
jgi:hypothetical protein